MSRKNNNDLFFTCSLIEEVGRMLHLKRGDVVASLGVEGVRDIYESADVLHCEPIAKVADEVITLYSLPRGDFDNVAEAMYEIPDVWSIGNVYSRLIEDASEEDNIIETLVSVYTSWIDEFLSDYNSVIYFQPREYIAECWRVGWIIDEDDPNDPYWANQAK